MAGTLLLWALATVAPPAVQVEIDTETAAAVLKILDVREAGEDVTEAHWAGLFDSEGYTRLKRREASMNRAFDDASFREFVLSDDLLARRRALQVTLDAWSEVDPAASGARALRYLPQGATIRATVYPMIKPKSNSFVFELTTDPAIFFYLDPAQPGPLFENVMTHELHHVGFATACAATKERGPGDVRVAEVRRWIGAFGEGLAMLAAAGGPDEHPQTASTPENRRRWDRDVAKFDRDLQRIQQFLVDILDGKLEDDQARVEVGRSFFGVQGPWYTVGWKMAVAIERKFGRERLIDAMCDPVGLLAAYNETAGADEPRWSEALLRRLEAD